MSSLSNVATVWMALGIMFSTSGGLLFVVGARKPRSGRKEMWIGGVCGCISVALGVWFSLQLHASATHLELWFDLLFGQMPAVLWFLVVYLIDAATGGYVVGRRPSWIKVNGKSVH